MTSYEAQREHMRTGAMYNDLTEELVSFREGAVLRSDAYNASFGRPAEERLALLRELLGSVEGPAHFEPTLRVEFGDGTSIGRSFYANFDCVLLDGGGITIGDDVLLGPRVSVYTSNHALDPAERAAGACYAKPVTIGNRVWVGGGVTINQGVTIGDGAVIGSGSVVTRDVPAGAIAAGVPARVIREITEADRTDYLATLGV